MSRHISALINVTPGALLPGSCFHCEYNVLYTYQ